MLSEELVTSAPACRTDGGRSKDANRRRTNWVEIYVVGQMAPYGVSLHLLQEAT